MKAVSWQLPGLLVLALVAGCDYGPKSSRGFVFKEGDSVRGKQAFIDLKCCTCHRVDGVADLPSPIVSPEKIVTLGGKVHHLRTYGQLVTALIHPTDQERLLPTNHPGSTAPALAMPVVNDRMTVMQMVDLVTFLQPRYQQLEVIYDENRLVR